MLSSPAQYPRHASTAAVPKRCPVGLEACAMGIIIALDYRRDATLFTAASLYKDPKRSFSEQQLSQFQVESGLSAILNLGRGPWRERTEP
jgi:hypothetical protein